VIWQTDAHPGSAINFDSFDLRNRHEIEYDQRVSLMRAPQTLSELMRQLRNRLGIFSLLLSNEALE